MTVSCLTKISQATASVDDFAPGEAHLLNVQVGLHLAEHGVVDPAFVAEPDDGCSFAGEQPQAQGGRKTSSTTSGGRWTSRSEGRNPASAAVASP
ncbi:hypothetical protein SRABI26_00848 [Arthrobacter sp. Bi26]|nr:hypothetical protein SRABI26_00848 [Arthrobacter sp. Bi26]